MCDIAVESPPSDKENRAAMRKSPTPSPAASIEFSDLQAMIVASSNGRPFDAPDGVADDGEVIERRAAGGDEGEEEMNAGDTPETNDDDVEPVEMDRKQMLKESAKLELELAKLTAVTPHFCIVGEWLPRDERNDEYEKKMSPKSSTLVVHPPTTPSTPKVTFNDEEQPASSSTTGKSRPAKSALKRTVDGVESSSPRRPSKAKKTRPRPAIDTKPKTETKPSCASDDQGHNFELPPTVTPAACTTNTMTKRAPSRVVKVPQMKHEEVFNHVHAIVNDKVEEATTIYFDMKSSQIFPTTAAYQSSNPGDAVRASISTLFGSDYTYTYRVSTEGTGGTIPSSSPSLSLVGLQHLVEVHLADDKTPHLYCRLCDKMLGETTVAMHCETLQHCVRYVHADYASVFDWLVDAAKTSAKFDSNIRLTIGKVHAKEVAQGKRHAVNTVVTLVVGKDDAQFIAVNAHIMRDLLHGEGLTIE